jgi:hypothetical protein
VKTPQCLWSTDRLRFTDTSRMADIGSGDAFGVGGQTFCLAAIALLRAITRSGIRDLRYVCWAGGLRWNCCRSGCCGGNRLRFSSLIFWPSAAVPLPRPGKYPFAIGQR